MNERIFRRGKGGSGLQALLENTENANRFLRILANETRLKILCFLTQGEKPVSEIRALIGLPQPTVSQQLSVLRTEGLVDSRRVGKIVYYKLKHPGTRGILECLQGVPDLGDQDSGDEGDRR